MPVNPVLYFAVGCVPSVVPYIVHFLINMRPPISASVANACSCSTKLKDVHGEVGWTLNGSLGIEAYGVQKGC